VSEIPRAPSRPPPSESGEVVVDPDALPIEEPETGVVVGAAEFIRLRGIEAAAQRWAVARVEFAAAERALAAALGTGRGA
jgi:hypothetical protein